MTLFFRPLSTALTIVFSTSLVFGSNVQGSSLELQCDEHFSFTRPRAYSFSSSLVSHGLDPELLSFKIDPQTLGDRSKALLIEVSYGSVSAATFMMVYKARQNKFESHSHVQSKFQNRGLGLFLYVLSAKIAHEKYNTELTSSWRPSMSAQSVWTWIVQNGWGDDVPEPKMSKWLRTIFREPKPPNRFRFERSVLDGRFDDIYEFFLGHCHSELPELSQLQASP